MGTPSAYTTELIKRQLMGASTAAEWCAGRAPVPAPPAVVPASSDAHASAARPACARRRRPCRAGPQPAGGHLRGPQGRQPVPVGGHDRGASRDAVVSAARLERSCTRGEPGAPAAATVGTPLTGSRGARRATMFPHRRARRRRPGGQARRCGHETPHTRAAPQHAHPFPPSRSEGGFFKAELKFPADFPNSPPDMKFLTPMYHPNSACATGRRDDLRGGRASFRTGAVLTPSPLSSRAPAPCACPRRYCSLPRRQGVHLHPARAGRGRVQPAGARRRAVAAHPGRGAGECEREGVMGERGSGSGLIMT
jgi:hypothetical protein